jgi:general secretion pathway protein G
MMRKAFTMVELIFVIVIIGILSAVAIPKLAATRDDAKVARAVMNLGICVEDIGTRYTAQTSDSIVGVKSCTDVLNEKCWRIQGTGDNDGNITVVPDNTNTQRWCVRARSQAVALKLQTQHIFGGSKVKL